MCRVTFNRLTAVIAAVLLVGACSDPAPTGQASTTNTTPAAKAANSPPPDPAGAKVCADIRKANVDPNVTPATMEAIGSAGQQVTDQGVRARAALLASSARLARAAKGQGDEVRLTLEMVTAGIELETACVTARYYAAQ
jgi:hypothetical protein